MNLASVDLNLLVALDAILTERHLTRAGERLGLTQPTMSHTLARLRLLFDDELLIRIGRQYQLTLLAQELREPLRDILNEIERTIEQRPAFDPAVDERVFTVAASDYATFLVFQPALQRIQDAAPNVRLEVHPLLHSRAPTEAGDIDLAIWPAGIGPDLPHEVLFTDRWVAIAWSGNEEVQDILTLKQYLALPHVAYGGSLHQHQLDAADRALLLSHPETRIAMSVESFFLLPFMLTNTQHIAFVHERLARRLSYMGDIKVLQLEFEAAPIEEAMYWHPRLTADPAHKWLRNLLCECTADIG